LLPTRWATAQRPATLLVVRVLIVANAVLLGVVGALYLFFAERPSGLVVTAVTWVAAAVLLALVPFTNPRRGRPERW
jgi:hypothetical protein